MLDGMQQFPPPTFYLKSNNNNKTHPEVSRVCPLCILYEHLKSAGNSKPSWDSKLVSSSSLNPSKIHYIIIILSIVIDKRSLLR